jgi:hypothetical protein
MNNIYGPLDNQSNIVLGIGNYNNVHGLLTSEDDILSMKLLSEITTPNVIELNLEYSDNLFSLSVKDTNKYVGVIIEDYNAKIAHTCISDTKTYFSVNYSSIDKTPRTNLFSGVLYSLQTTINNISYTVSWKINNLPNGDLILFLPLSWYDDTCTIKDGLITLVESLKQLNYKGYTNEHWCHNVKNIIHCDDEQKCGICLGHCDNTSEICDLNDDNTFVCVASNITVNDQTNNDQNNNQANYTWLAVILVLLIILLLWWFFS